MTIQLRDGTTTEDRRLDRLVQFDERSRGHGIRALLPTRKPRSYTWRLPENRRLNQGEEGACVSAGCHHELMARPCEAGPFTMAQARVVYHEAQRIDPWPGGSYPGASPRYEGTSVLAGVKILHGRGYFKSYRWAFGLDDLVDGLGYFGPAVLGLNWYSGMHNTDAEGRIQPTGRLTGGHAILAHSVNVKLRRVWLVNSWGLDWGIRGRCWLSFDDLEHVDEHGRLRGLLHEDGEAVFFQKRSKGPQA